MSIDSVGKEAKATMTGMMAGSVAGLSGFHLLLGMPQFSGKSGAQIAMAVAFAIASTVAASVSTYMASKPD